MIDTSLQIKAVNVSSAVPGDDAEGATAKADTAALGRTSVRIAYTLVVSRNISSGTVDYPFVWGGVQWSTLSVQVCNSGSVMKGADGGDGSSGSVGDCPLVNGTTVTVVGTAKGLMRGAYDARVTSNGYTPGFQGLRVLACMGTLSFTL
jgi:hypothetical protein